MSQQWLATALAYDTARSSASDMNDFITADGYGVREHVTDFALPDQARDLALAEVSCQVYSVTCTDFCQMDQ